MIDTGLQGRIALVTGANKPRGIGAATARALAAQGATVFITAFGAPPAEEVLQTLRAEGARVSYCEIDLADASLIPPLFDRVEAEFGPVEVLVNNAAAWEEDTFNPEPDARDWGGRPTFRITAASHDHHFAVNSRATALMMAEFARRHAQRRATWGRIINLSTGGAPAFPGEISYGASKNALESYSRAAAKELARYGITVNIVSPGATQTGWITPDIEKHILPTIPMGRIGQPQDIADVITFLASEQARWITGQLIQVDGGQR